MQQKNRQMIRWRKNKEEGKEGERRTEADEGYVCVWHVLFLKLEGEAGFVLLRGAQSVEKQEAKGPAHPRGQLVPSDSCSPFLLASYNSSHPGSDHLETNTSDHSLSSIRSSSN